MSPAICDRVDIARRQLPLLVVVGLEFFGIRKFTENIHPSFKLSPASLLNVRPGPSVCRGRSVIVDFTAYVVVTNSIVVFYFEVLCFCMCVPLGLVVGSG